MKDSSIQQLFQISVVKNPNTVALILENEVLTYIELNQQANQLANYLRKLGVEPEVIVGLCIDRCPKMVVAILAILKAGGAYLPLDPLYPKERLAFILEDAQVPIVLTQTQHLERLPQSNAKVVCLDKDWNTITQESQENTVNQATADSLVYVIYTSGSTGKPKGVTIKHKSLVNFTKVVGSEYALQPGDRVLQFASISFDAAAEEIFPCLVCGATLVLRTKDMLTSIHTFLKKCRDFKLTVLDLPTAFWHQLCLEMSREKLAIPDTLRLVIIGGERANPQHLKIWQKYVSPKIRLMNTYGPTEATIVTTMCDLAGPKAIDTSGRVLPIGRAIDNVEIYVLDSSVQPVPNGEIGELFIGGVGLARGYLNQPELTDEKFIANPFSQNSSDRLYRTGDLVRQRQDGNLEFFDRIDYQEKIRGFRVELGEIEAILHQHPDVGDAIVIVREDVPLNKRLAAYVVPKQKCSNQFDNNASLPFSEITISSFAALLRNYLKDNLPEYMIPSDFTLIEALPLLPNGKVDRRALPLPIRIRSQMAAKFVKPRTFVEKILVKIWCEIFNLEQVSIYDNFFDLGGHSLLLTQLFTQIQLNFHLELKLSTLSQIPTTIAGLAAVIENAFQVESYTTIDPKSEPKTGVNLNAEAVLEPTICTNLAVLQQVVSEPTRIFLTGATGFLGTFLLHELLLQSQADIYCLVRSSSVEEGKQRLENILKAASLWRESQSSRIIPVLGDLSQPLLGLSKEQFQALTKKIDVIYHNGALVNYTYPYSALKATNVLGTQEVLRLASQIKVKPVHFVSTVDVFPTNRSVGVKVIHEWDSLDHRQVFCSSYAQSKWVAEKLVAIARSRGLPVCIYRPGRISGHSQTGFSNYKDFLFILIRGCIQLGSIPNLNTEYELTPVDYVSQAIVYLSQQKESLNKAFHLINPQPVQWKRLFKWVSSFGYPLEQILYDKWQTRVREVIASSPSNVLYPLVLLLSQQEIEAQAWNSELLQFDCQNTLNGLAGTSISCPLLDYELFGTYLSYLTSIGLLDTPKLELTSNC